MRTVREIEEALFRLAPMEMKEDWDNVGLLCGHSDKQVERILVALDPFPDVAAEAESCRCTANCYAPSADLFSCARRQ